MPLSEDEQRILHDIERNFYENDPKFAEAVSSSALYRHARRNAVYAGIGFVVSLVVVLGSFFLSPFIAFVAFVAMLASAFVFFQNVRRISVSGAKDVVESERVQQANESLQEFKLRWRNKFRRP